MTLVVVRNKPRLVVLRAQARPTDPETSHAAAASLPSERIRRSQADVLRVLAMGPTNDMELFERYLEQADAGVVGYQSVSGVRTRRKELVRQGQVRDSGRRDRMLSGRMAVVWEVAR